MSQSAVHGSERAYEDSLADWVVDTNTLSEADELIARTLLLDSLGVMESGSRSSVAHKVFRSIGDDPEAMSGPLGGRIGFSMLAAQRGTAGAAELWDDTSLRMLTHPSVPILSALLDESADANRTFGELLIAFAIGLKVQMAVAEPTSKGMYERGFHATGVLGSVAAAAAVARARGLDARGASVAMSIGASLGSGLRIQFGSDAMPLHSGFAAVNGVNSARLAERGITADAHWLSGRFGFAATFAGQERVGRWDGPRGLSHADIVIKQHPVGAPNAAPVNAALKLRSEWPHRPDDIVELNCEVHRWVLNTVKLDTPEIASEGRVSLPYCLAAAIAMGEDLAEAFLGEGRIPQQLGNLSEKVRVTASDVLDDAGRPTARVEMLTRAGQRFSAMAHDSYILPHLDGANGDRVLAKFRKCWRRPSATAVEQFVVKEPLDANVDRLLALLPYSQKGMTS